MTSSIPTERALFEFLLARMRRLGAAVAYPRLFVLYVDQLIDHLTDFSSGTERLYPRSVGQACPCCGIEAGAAVLASLTSAPDRAGLGTCNRLLAALALDLLAQLPLGLSLSEVNAAMIGVLGLDRDNLVRVVIESGNLRWETTRAGAAALGTCVWILHARA